MEKEIVIASSNEGKIREVKEILNEYKIISMKELGIDIEVEEDKKTFEKNAIKKAETIAKHLDNKMCISDDSGIEIEYLDGFPGVETKRWNQGTSRDRNLLILDKMKGLQKEDRKVKFICAIAISDGVNTICERGEIEGYISENLRGDNGFGFDEIFELENGKTLAELSNEEKNEISPRRKALEAVKIKLLNK